MADQYIGEIRVFTYMRGAPSGWLLCDGSLQAIANYEVLASLIGTTFGGDGITNFGLPNLQGSVMLHQGQLTGGQVYGFGSTGGTTSVTLNTPQLPSHSHTLNAASPPSSAATTYMPGSATLVADAVAAMYAPNGTTDATLSPGSIGLSSGASAPHANVQPVMGCVVCIAWDGIYPARQN